MYSAPVCTVVQPSHISDVSVRNASNRIVNQPHCNRQKLADRLEDLAIELRSFAEQSADTIPSTPTLMGLARKIYISRRAVDEVFNMEGFAVSPAWDIMLDLYQAHLQGKRISVTSACIGGACPPTTGLRWLQALESSNLVAREPDPQDKRRQVVALTDGAVIKVEKALRKFL